MMSRPATTVLRSSHPGPYVIAEIGVNHEGDVDLARRLIDEAAAGGADAVKFQTYKASKIASKNSPSYWDLECEPTESQHELFSKYDKFREEDYRALATYARDRNVTFCSTPFDLDAVEWLAPLMPFFKIASADITNFPLLRACAAHGKPLILSTGASYLSEIDEAVRVAREYLPANEVALLHCVLEYPTPYDHAELGAITHLRAAFPDHPIGYSDHTRPDGAMAVLTHAWLLGAEVIEKHFTHDKTLPGNDHYHAMNHDDLGTFRRVNSLLTKTQGRGLKTVLEGERVSRRNARRSLVATRDLPAGHQLTEDDLMAKRPAFGLPPQALEWVIGRRLSKAISNDEFLTDDHLLGDREQ